MDKGTYRVDTDALVAKAGGDGQCPQLDGLVVDGLLLDAADDDGIDDGDEEVVAMAVEILLAARLEEPAPLIAGENAGDNGHLLVAGDAAELLGEVVGDHRAAALNGEQLVLDGVLARREDMHAVAGAHLDHLADAVHGIAKVDVGDGVAELAERLAQAVGIEGVDLVTAGIDERAAFKKDQLVEGLGIVQHRPVEIDIRHHPHHLRPGQLALQLLLQFLVGKAVGKIVKEADLDGHAAKKLEVGDDLGKVIAQYPLAAGDPDPLAG